MSEQQSPDDPSRPHPAPHEEGVPEEGVPDEGVPDGVVSEEDAGGELEVPPSSALPLWVRISLLMVGWLLLLIGIAGLVLPGIQGIATILFGAAVLSLASEMVYELLRRGFQRWPSVWQRFETFREKMRGWLHRRT